MKIKALVDKYIVSVENALGEIEQNLSQHDEGTILVMNSARRYLQDAQYFRTKRNFATALASVAYSEGLIDALRLLKLVKFQWSRED